jgi:glycosyltransferase involved in cell wall biosynthesis
VKIAFDARVLEQPRLAERGIGRYASCLLTALEQERPGRVAVMRRLARPSAPARFAEALEHLMLARDVRRTGADVVHSPAIDLASLRPGAPLVVTVHDLAPLRRPDLYLRTGAKHRLRYAAVRRASRVIVPSHAVARDAERLLGVHAQVVPEAAAPVFAPVERPREALAKIDLPERFLLWVGGLDPPDPRKGVEALAAAVRRRDGLPLVLAGRPGEEARGLAAPGRVLLAGRLADAELAALYSAADALVFPSEDEGYGLPPVEALACGTPVAAYSAGSLPETLDGAHGATLVEPGNLDGLLAAAEAIAGTRAEPLGRTWREVARETWAVYESAM